MTRFLLALLICLALGVPGTAMASGMGAPEHAAMAAVDADDCAGHCADASATVDPGDCQSCQAACGGALLASPMRQPAERLYQSAYKAPTADRAPGAFSIPPPGRPPSRG